MSDPTKVSIPNVEDIRNPDDFQRIVGQAQNILARLKPLNYDAIYEEIQKLNVKTSENPHVQQLNFDLQAVQAAKDRISEISVEILRHAITYRRVADLLTEGWVKYSNESSVDKRKADALLRMSNFENAAVEAETLHKATLGVLKNLDSKHEATSRQITCFHLMLKLRDVGRTTPEASFLPDDFGSVKDLPSPFGAPSAADSIPSPVSQPSFQPAPSLTPNLLSSELSVARTTLEHNVSEVQVSSSALKPDFASSNSDQWSAFGKM